MAQEQAADDKDRERSPAQRIVPADLIETSPEKGALFHWVLASPVLIFLAWLWVDLFAYASPIPFYWVDVALGLILYVSLIVLPLGLAAHALVAALPVVFGHAGWDVQPLEPVREAEQYTVRYRYQRRIRAATTWPRLWMRAGQGWVYLEIALILTGGILIIPLFFSAADFGFGR